MNQRFLYTFVFTTEFLFHFFFCFPHLCLHYRLWLFGFNENVWKDGRKKDKKKLLEKNFKKYLFFLWLNSSIFFFSFSAIMQLYFNGSRNKFLLFFIIHLCQYSFVLCCVCRIMYKNYTHLVWCMLKRWGDKRDLNIHFHNNITFYIDFVGKIIFCSKHLMRIYFRVRILNKKGNRKT